MIFNSTSLRQESQLFIIPVPWEATVSYGSGTSQGPQAILEASVQLDYWDFEWGDIRQKGIYWDGPQREIECQSQKYKEIVQSVQKGLSASIPDQIDSVNQASRRLNQWLYNKTLPVISENKAVGVVGGDHSCPLGSMQAYCEKYNDLGVLHIDAHADLRKDYQGFKFSHASIMRNLMELENPPATLVQVGVRDYCEAEKNYIEAKENIKCFFDRTLKKKWLSGISWEDLCRSIVKELPCRVYISFDIDGLDPELCPHTGTPVPGGLSYDQVVFLFNQLIKSGRQIVGFDLCEVAPGPQGEWDGNVGARILYQLCGLTLFKTS